MFKLDWVENGKEPVTGIRSLGSGRMTVSKTTEEEVSTGPPQLHSGENSSPSSVVVTFGFHGSPPCAICHKCCYWSHCRLSVSSREDTYMAISVNCGDFWFSWFSPGAPNSQTAKHPNIQTCGTSVRVGQSSAVVFNTDHFVVY